MGTTSLMTTAMASSLSVNLSVTSPRKKETENKIPGKVSRKLRALLPTSTSSETVKKEKSTQKIDTGADSQSQSQNRLVGPGEDESGNKIRDPQSASCPKLPVKHSTHSVGHASSQTSARGSQSHEKSHKRRNRLSKRRGENESIQWLLPKFVNEPGRKHHHHHHTLAAQACSGDHHLSSAEQDEDEVETGVDGRSSHGNTQETKISKMDLAKVDSAGSYHTLYIHGRSRSTRGSKYNRIKPSSRPTTSSKEPSMRKAIEILTRNCQLYRDELKFLEEKSSKELIRLETENEQLQVEAYQLQQQVQEWKSKCQRQENRNVVLAKMKVLEKENQMLKGDAEVLKSVVRRLNKEMSFYQEKLRSKYRSDPRKIPFYSSSNSNSNYEGDDNEHEDGEDRWLRDPSRELQPLLIAYDEIIDEKNEIIKDYEMTMERFKQKCQGIVGENERLHKVMAESKQKGTVSFEEWQFLYDNAVLVLEENDLLHKQILTLKNKAAVLQRNHEDKENQLQLKISLLEEERSKMNMVTVQLDKHCKMLTDQAAKLTQSVQNRIPVEEHEASVRECKRLFEDLKKNYEEDRANLTGKLTAVESEKHRIIIELTDLGTENAKLQGTVKDLQNSLANNHVKLKDMYAKMQETSKAKDATAKTVAEMMELAKAVVQDRETLEKSLYEQQNLNVRMMSIRSQQSGLVNELREKIKNMEDAHSSDIQKLVHKIKDLENILDSIGERHQSDIFKLEDVIQEKSKQIETLIAEKNQLAEDLETVWRATTNAAKT